MPVVSSTRLFLASLTLLVAGCNPLLPEPPSPPALFDFGPLPTAVETDDAPAVQLQALRAPTWLTGPRIPYRQLHRQPEAVQYYARHSWVAAPTELLRQRLEHQLAATPRGSGGWLLEIDLLTFEQVFESEDRARAEISLRASLHERRGEGRTLRRNVRVVQSVDSEVRGAVSGLPAVADEAINELVAWLKEVTSED